MQSVITKYYLYFDNGKPQAQDIDHTRDSQKTMTGEIWRVFLEYFEEKWLYYTEILPYYISCATVCVIVGEQWK